MLEKQAYTVRPFSLSDRLVAFMGTTIPIVITFVSMGCSPQIIPNALQKLQNVVVNEGTTPEQQSLIVSITGNTINHTTNSPVFFIEGLCNSIGATITVKLDSTNVPLGGSGGTCNGLAWSGTIDTTFLPEGTHSLQAILTSQAGQTVESETVNLFKDTSTPSVTLTSLTSSPTNASPISVTATFSEPVTGFAVDDLVITNATVSNFTGTGTLYTFNLTPSGQGAITAQIPADVAQDGAGNGNSAADSLTRNFDSVRPDVSITSTFTSPAYTPPIPVTVTFSEAVTGFDAGKVSVSNGTLTDFAGSGTTYTFNIAPTAAGPVTVDIAANQVQDAATNWNTAATRFGIAYGEERFYPLMRYSEIPGGSLSITGLDRHSSGWLVASGWFYTGGQYRWLTLKSVDEGETWTKSEEFALSNLMESKAMRTKIVDANTAVVVGYSEDSTGLTHWIVRKTTDRGATWNTVDNFVRSGPADTYAEGLAIANDGTWWSCGYTLDSPGRWIVRKSIDQGANWTSVEDIESPLSPDYDAQCHGIDVDNSGQIYATGKYADSAGRTWYVVRRSSNNGSSWTTIDSHNFVYDYAFANRVHQAPDGTLFSSGFITDTDYSPRWIVRRSTDGGGTWTTVDFFQYASSYESYAKDLAIKSDGSLFAIGSFNTDSGHASALRRSTDNGGTWVTYDQVLADDVNENALAMGSAERLLSAGTHWDGSAWIRQETSSSPGTPSSVRWIAPNKVSINDCAPYELYLTDSSKNPAFPNQNVNISISADPSIQWFSDEDCLVSTSSTQSISAFSSHRVIYGKASTAGSFAITANATGLSPSSRNVTVLPPNAKKLRVTGATGIQAGICAGPYSIELLDNSNQPTTSPVALEATVAAYLSISGTYVKSGQVRIFSDAGCTTASDTVSLAPGQSSANFYIIPDRTHSFHLTATSGWFTTVDSSLIQAEPEAPIGINILGQSTLPASECSQAFSVESVDANGFASGVPSNVTISLSSSGAGAFYSDSNCQSSIANLSIPSGGDSAIFYYKGTSAGAVTLTAGADSGLGNDTFELTITAQRTAHHLRLDGPRNIKAGACSAAYTLWLNDNSGKPVTAEGPRTVSLYAMGEGRFFSDSACTTQIDSVNFSTGENYQIIYFKDNRAEFGFLQASSVGLIDALWPVIVQWNTASVSRFVVSGNAFPVVNSCTPYNIQVSDSFGNATPTTGNTTVTLSGAGTGAFYSNATCSSSIGSIAIPIGQVAATVYFKNPSANSARLLATSGTIQAGWVDVKTLPASDSLLLKWNGSATAPEATCSGPYSIGTLDPASGAPSAVSSDKTISISSTGSALFYSDAVCTPGNEIGQITILSGTSSSADFYIQDAVTETITVTASDGTLFPDSLGIRVGSPTAGAISKLLLAGPSSASLAACTGPFTVQTADANNIAAPVGSNTTVNLYYPGYGTFYSGPDCSSSITTVSISTGTSQATFYYRNQKIESVMLNARSGAWTEGYLPLTVAPLTAVGLQITGPTRVVATACGGPFIVSGRDSNQNIAMIPAGTIIRLSSDPSVSFFSDSNCITPLVSNEINFTVPSTEAKYYLKKSTEGSSTLEVTDLSASLKKQLYPVFAGPLPTLLAIGSLHSCAIFNGALKCWGNNTFGQLGSGNTDPSDVPLTVPGFETGVTAITLTNYSTCAVKNGAAYCWGQNEDGILGDGLSSYIPVTSPSPIPGLSSGVTSITLGEHFACAIVSGSAKCWGRQGVSGTDTGYLGNGVSGTALSGPVQVSGLTSGVLDIAAFRRGACALVSGGGIKCWGYGYRGEIGDNNCGTNYTLLTPVNVNGMTSGNIKVKAGYETVCALTGAGALKCWGQGFYGELGNNSTINWCNPQQPLGLTSGVTDFTLGEDHTCAVHNGAVKCFGKDAYIGIGSINTSAKTLTPVNVLGLDSGATVIASALQSNSTCAIVHEKIHCWGTNYYANLGIGNSSTLLQPTALPLLGASVSSLSLGSGYACRRTTAGAAQCWGQNNYGQLGDGTTTLSSNPVNVTGLTSGVSAISTANLGFQSFTCAIHSGAAKCWGNNANGQLGDGSFTQRTAPVQVSGLTSGVTAIDTGGGSSCAVASGSIYCWGVNGYGQLAQPSNIFSSNVPLAVSIPGTASQVALGAEFSCGLIDGSVYCWGKNTFGQIGNNEISGNAVRVPTLVQGITGSVVQIAAGESHACALTSTGAVYCWGDNSNGQLGSPDFSLAPVARRILDLSSGVGAISLGNNHSCALLSGGNVACWGSNNYGELGNGTVISSSIPEPVIGLSSIQSIAAGNSASCAIDTAGTPLCWGQNTLILMSSGGLEHTPVPSLIDLP